MNRNILADAIATAERYRLGAEENMVAARRDLNTVSSVQAAIGCASDACKYAEQAAGWARIAAELRRALGDNGSGATG